MTITIESAIAENLDVFATPFPKGDRLLEWMPEVVALPVLDVVCELIILVGILTHCKKKLTLIVPSRFT